MFNILGHILLRVMWTYYQKLRMIPQLRLSCRKPRYLAILLRVLLYNAIMYGNGCPV